MLHKNRKMSQLEVDEIYEDFVIEIATKVARQVKGKVYYGFTTVEGMWYVIVKTRELGEKRFFLDMLDYDMLSGVSSKEIADNIVKFYHRIIESRFFIIWILELKVNLYRRYRLIKIIWTYKYTDSTNFKANIMLLISMVSGYTYMIYGNYSQLVALNDFYKCMCLKEMHKRLMIEAHNFS